MNSAAGGAQLQFEGAFVVAARGRDKPLRIVVAVLHNPECINLSIGNRTSGYLRKFCA